MKKIGRLLFGFVFFVIANSAFAEVFCVDTAEELQAALTIASANDQDDEVRIVQGTYVGNFVYATATEAYDLAVKGGYAAGCSSQALDPVTTILDGNQTGTVLAVSAGNVTADLSVQGLTLRNGNKDGYGGGLYFAVGSEGTVSVEANVIMGNSANYAGGGVYVSSSGDVTFTNNSIESNINNGAYVGTSGGTITFTNNVIGSNSSTGAHLVTSGGTVVFTNNTIGNNSEGGAFASGGTVAFINNTIQNNGSYGVFVGNYGDSFTYTRPI